MTQSPRPREPRNIRPIWHCCHSEFCWNPELSWFSLVYHGRYSLVVVAGPFWTSTIPSCKSVKTNSIKIRQLNRFEKKLDNGGAHGPFKFCKLNQIHWDLIICCCIGLWFNVKLCILYFPNIEQQWTIYPAQILTKHGHNQQWSLINFLFSHQTIS